MLLAEPLLLQELACASRQRASKTPGDVMLLHTWRICIPAAFSASHPVYRKPQEARMGIGPQECHCAEMNLVAYAVRVCLRFVSCVSVQLSAKI